jgi:hypothetical protein
MKILDSISNGIGIQRSLLAVEVAILDCHHVPR